MRHELYEKTITCPYCWESFSICIEPGLDVGESYVEDCYVCCRPIEITLRHADDDDVQIRVAQIEGNAF